MPFSLFTALREGVTAWAVAVGVVDFLPES
ncbi:hypothetical protein M878_00780 [Streptomyces roseochromogenus subsp. oscitans DS 12.976]|uniref:Uncharacterized protein n=1 Tax=Streptomyces roseochromogenus subsp. oscitans DS 12.976 TaxID=1352936 RepID=V6KX27_STRRC|nr:hypothetical protein M878_00780 [Streptomyces roseochromogenus subsp. oscitans DS 12.976]